MRVKRLIRPGVLHPGVKRAGSGAMPGWVTPGKFMDAGDASAGRTGDPLRKSSCCTLFLPIFLHGFSFLEDFPSAFVYSLTDVSEAAVFGPVYFTPELSVPVLRMRAMHQAGRTGDPLEVVVLQPFFIDFPSRLFFLDDFPSAFVYSLTDASEAAGFGTVYFTPELSVPGLVQCQDG
ncbi:hypothetical protein Acr_07g0000980 [Actinidia rufa]|uniref:Uncharacterized protein n=1 Tax=Actinidia rufa TaxID=165716 RepID=A0A7J0ETT6_9ERIC|nr:hypothetical protein Acr_07g0000980 [Actinidia rufa]